MNDNNGTELLAWLVIIGSFIVFWPLGVVLLVRKLNEPGSKRAMKQVKEKLQKAEAEKKARHEVKKSPPKVPGGGAVTALLIVAIVLLLVGVGSIDKALSSDGSTLRHIIMSVFYLLGGGASLLARLGIKRRMRRLQKYIAIIGDSDVVRLSELSEKTGISQKRVRSDIEELVSDGFFGGEAYIDVGLESLVRSSDVAESERRRRYAEDRAAEIKNAPQNRYMTILQELSTLNDDIVDGPISDKITRIQELTAKIFKTVEADPEKAGDIRKFMDYYLPTTLKLLRSYATLERQGIEGENISSAKADIGRILDTLASGYEQQLDLLYKSDMIDISADIDVLETMMKQDGLSGGEPFTMGGH